MLLGVRLYCNTVLQYYCNIVVQSFVVLCLRARSCLKASMWFDSICQSLAPPSTAQCVDDGGPTDMPADLLNRVIQPKSPLATTTKASIEGSVINNEAPHCFAQIAYTYIATRVLFVTNSKDIT